MEEKIKKITPKKIKGILSRTKTGAGLANHGPNSIIMRQFNCGTCSWIGSTLCPHRLKKGERHRNGICSQRALFLKENFKIAGTRPKYFQMEEAVKLKVIEDKMMSEWAETGELHKDFTRISRNIIQLTDKMRRQDEGIKIQGDIVHTHQDFRNIVDAQAKIIETKDGKKPDITRRQMEDGEQDTEV